MEDIFELVALLFRLVRFMFDLLDFLQFLYGIVSFVGDLLSRLWASIPWFRRRPQQKLDSVSEVVRSSRMAQSTMRGCRAD